MSERPDLAEADLDPAAADLLHLLSSGLERGGHLLAAGEVLVVRRILGLPRDPARVFALLSARTHDRWPEAALRIRGVDDLPAALQILRDLQLIDGLVPRAQRAARLTRKALVQHARTLGFQATGSREELIARLLADPRWAPGRWVRVRHRGLVQRLSRWALLRKRPDRATLVTERLGHVRWPDYALTEGPTVHPHRRALLGWEALWADESPDPERLETLFRRIRAGHHLAPGHLDLRATLRERLLGLARALERDGQLAAARRLYRRTAESLGAPVAVRIARTLELEGRPQEALEVLLHSDDGTDPLARQRAGRRVARTLRRAWPPSPPQRRPKTRAIRLEPDDRPGRRPTYRVGAQRLPVEPATIQTLQNLGREALHAEGALWQTLAALLLAECYFLPIPGALPVRYLSGPLDLGTPAFRARRAEAVNAVLEGLRRGEGPARISAADARWRGVRLSGASFDLASPAQLRAVAEGIGPRALAAWVERFADLGPRAAAGMPDLVILPGPAAHIPGAVPGHLPESLLLAELKGPGDSLRDAQRRWLDRLLRLGAPVELWEVRPGAVQTTATPLSRSPDPSPPLTFYDPLPSDIIGAGTQLALLPVQNTDLPVEEDPTCPRN